MIQTQVFGVEDKYADHLITTTTAFEEKCLYSVGP